MTHVPEPTDPAAELASLRAEVERLRKALETIRDEHASDGHFWMCECDGGRWTCDTWLEANAALNPPPKEQP